jgi:hypothetical protein
LTRFIDSDLAEEESIWLQAHLDGCQECGSALTRLADLDAELTGWGERLTRENPPLVGADQRLISRLSGAVAGRRPHRWIPIAAVAAAVALVFAVLLPHGKSHPGTSVSAYGDTGFVGIPYVAPIDPRENATIVRMEIRAATLIAAGYKVSAEPDAVIPADVLVGEDGRAHAVRLPSNIELSGVGD